MAFRATNQIPEQGLARAKALAVRTRDYCQSRSTQFAAGGVNSDNVLATFHDLRRARDELDQVKAIPGIADYAKAQENDAGYDVAAEFAALVTAVEAVMTEIQTSFPVDANGYLLEKQWAPDGTYTFRQFSAAQLATAKTLLDAVVAQVA